MLFTQKTALQRQTEEFERLKKVYPLLTFEMDDKGSVTVHTGVNSSLICNISEYGHLDRDAQHHIDTAHMTISISKDLTSLYPDLHITAFAGHTGINISVWLDRDGRDAEAIGNINITDCKLHCVLSDWQEEAHKAKQDGWFFCSGHDRAEQVEKGGYFWFAGKYCKQYGEENPSHRRSAVNQNYE